MRILVVENVTKAGQPLQQTLRDAGHGPVVLSDRENALDTSRLGKLDLVILHFDAPEAADWRMIERLKELDPSRPNLLVTTATTLQEQQLVRNEVVSDFLVKPFEAVELVARVDALARRQRDETTLVLRAGELWVDLAANDLYRGSRHIHVTPRELHLLKVLMREPKRVFSREEICQSVWGRAHQGEMKLVEVSVSRLRQKLGSPNLIHTVRKYGYTLRKVAPDSRAAAPV